jgi:hypothetical protein
VGAGGATSLAAVVTVDTTGAAAFTGDWAAAVAVFQQATARTTSGTRMARTLRDRPRESPSRSCGGGPPGAVLRMGNRLQTVV